MAKLWASKEIALLIGSYPVRTEINHFATKSLQIGTVKVPNRVILAPMSGITDAPFRRLAERRGAGLVVSEMTACAALVEGQREARVRSEGRGAARGARAQRGAGGRHPRRATRRLRGPLDGGRRPPCGGAGRARHRYQH